MQLVKSEEDNYLIGNPKITFFKVKPVIPLTAFAIWLARAGDSSIGLNLILPKSLAAPDIPLPATFGSATFGESEFGAAENPLVRQAVEGTGNTVAFRLKSDDQRSPYSINGFYIDYMPAGRK